MARAYTPIGWENGTKEAEAYVTISGVDYEVTPEQWDGNTPVDATNLDHMEKGIQNSYDVKLLAVTDTEPSECVTGDVYYNTTNKLLYTATGTDTWSSTGTEPLEGILYIVFDEENNQGNSYSWNGTDLSSVGGGGGGSSDIIIVEPDEPTEETKLVIEEEDLDFQYQTGDTLPVGSEVDVPDDTTIPDGWVEVNGYEEYTITPAYTHASNSYQAFKVGKVATITATIILSSITKDTVNNLATIPTEMLPSKTTMSTIGVVKNGSGLVIGVGSIAIRKSDGVIYIVPDVSSGTTTTVVFTITYLTD